LNETPTQILLCPEIKKICCVIKSKNISPLKLFLPRKDLKPGFGPAEQLKQQQLVVLLQCHFSLSLYITLGDKPDGALPEADKAGIRTAVCHTWQGMLLFCYPYRRCSVHFSLFCDVMA